MLNCICEGMKKIKILLLSLLPAVGLCAQNPLLVLEAEDAAVIPCEQRTTIRYQVSEMSAF